MSWGLAESWGKGAARMAVAILSGLALAMGWMACADTTPARPGSERFFVEEVKPFLQYYCVECHNSVAAPQHGGLSLENARAAMTTGAHAPVIRPGSPEKSLLFQYVKIGPKHTHRMPPGSEQMMDAGIANVRAWIAAGAPWPSGTPGEIPVRQ